MTVNIAITRIKLFIAAFIIATMAATQLLTAQASAASANVKTAQDILTKFTIPVGTADGVFGAQTARGLCAYRYIAGMTTSRSNVSTSFMTSLNSFNSKYKSLAQVPAPAKGGNTTYLVVEKKCQVMFYVQNGRYVKVLPVSTGIQGHRTPNGSFLLGNTNRGWSCSNLYEGSCRTQTSGRFASVKQTTGKFAGKSNYGNMYNKRFFKSGGYFIHGSTSVPTSPASHGCIRVTVAASDWMYDNVGNNGAVRLYVVNEY
jgi:lipoprotein-anchoring transpeptidase ErfK/SrfK